MYLSLWPEHVYNRTGHILTALLWKIFGAKILFRFFSFFCNYVIFFKHAFRIKNAWQHLKRNVAASKVQRDRNISASPHHWRVARFKTQCRRIIYAPPHPKRSFAASLPRRPIPNATSPHLWHVAASKTQRFRIIDAAPLPKRIVAALLMRRCLKSATTRRKMQL